MSTDAKACGTFSFTLAVEWDYVKAKDLPAYRSNAYALPINQRLNMQHAVQMLLKTGNWTPCKPVTDISRENLLPCADGAPGPLYNEYLYFCSHMRRMIYNQADWTDPDARDGAVAVLRRKAEAECYCLYRYFPAAKGQPARIRQYRLPVSAIELRLYAIGIMLLTIRCQNEALTQQGFYQYVDCDAAWKPLNGGQAFDVQTAGDLSWIENCGRRLFASRTVPEGDVQSDFFNDFPVYSCIAPAKQANPRRVGPDKADAPIVICDLTALVEKSADCTAPEHLAFVEKLIAPRCCTKARLDDAVKANAPAKSGGCLLIDSFNDDRMYVHGTIESAAAAERLQAGWAQRTEPGAADGLREWYGILYSDGNWSATCQDPAMLLAAVEAATAGRWCRYGTFHGVTYHSMLMLTGANPPAYLLSNNDWIYLQMFLIGVLQRCAVQRFYREASGLLQTRSSRDDMLRAAVQDKYTLFLNQFWFYEVTEQEQGKSMFSKLQTAMNIERDVEFLDRALEELHQQNENRTASAVNKLLVPMSILGGLWTCTEMGLRIRDALVANGWGNLMFFPHMGAFCSAVLLVLMLAAFVWGLIGYFSNRKYLKRKSGKHKSCKFRKR